MPAALESAPRLPARIPTALVAPRRDHCGGDRRSPSGGRQHCRCHVRDLRNLHRPRARQPGRCRLFQTNPPATRPGASPPRSPSCRSWRTATLGKFVAFFSSAKIGSSRPAKCSCSTRERPLCIRRSSLCWRRFRKRWAWPWWLPLGVGTAATRQPSRHGSGIKVGGLAAHGTT